MRIGGDGDPARTYIEGHFHILLRPEACEYGTKLN